MSLSKYHRWTNWIGTDESGKGDYFGSLVVAGVFVGEETCHDLRAIGVADSKKLSDQKIRAIAPQIFETHTNRVAWVELDPPAYNQRYESLRQNGQNLNDMLADLHAGIIQTLIDETNCLNVIVDRFANQDVLRKRVEKILPEAQLLQVPKAESDIAVAAASIIARYFFLQQIENLSHAYGLTIPKGAVHVVDLGRQFVQIYGKQQLRNVAKLHFRTTSDILAI
ncbi:TPA: ribonuclease HIII [Candidatus Poribacteria bacterium]|jgi:ribonuclease HIII|nr:ribonuclease HIII [Candidatus Poribacteria bacterium]HIB86241.1 ribonuclease HIII [Candidatus Poribacteria bacterium]HIC00590.1 ribonuclease HIII [Candidatus Poribacteria bacterium]HIC19485.1 ribonuclease HIII [Candidatus Poribacteria bacterium]HIM11186.1 ribonuclease HIII [Candidatus Poribacteria bacterium]